MLKYKRLLFFIISFALALTVRAATAAEDTIALKSQVLAKATAEATFRDSLFYNEKDVIVNVWGLQPNAVYTVWFAKEDRSDFEGIGVRDYSFKTDGSGNGSFLASVPDYQFGRWDYIELAYHPDGNPANLDNAVVAFRGDIDRIRR